MIDERKARRVIDFIQCLKHTKGEFHGKPFRLLPWQEKIIRDVFGTVKENGYRQYNTAYVEIPKKNGKSELAAGVALYMTCGDNEWGAEVYCCASDRQQASIVFDVAVDMVDQCPALRISRLWCWCFRPGQRMRSISCCRISGYRKKICGYGYAGTMCLMMYGSSRGF